jgi:hypothetical protein
VFSGQDIDQLKSIICLLGVLKNRLSLYRKLSDIFTLCHDQEVCYLFYILFLVRLYRVWVSCILTSLLYQYYPDYRRTVAITQLFLRNTEFKTSATHCCANQFWILLLFMMKNCFYSNKLIWGVARLCRGSNSTTSSFFVFRCLSIFWFTNGCSTSLCLTLQGSMRCANRLSCQFVDARYNLYRTTAMLTSFNVDVKNPFKSLRLGHRLVFLCPCFFLPCRQCLFSLIS